MKHLNVWIYILAAATVFMSLSGMRDSYRLSLEEQAASEFHLQTMGAE